MIRHEEVLDHVDFPNNFSHEVLGTAAEQGKVRLEQAEAVCQSRRRLTQEQQGQLVSTEQSTEKSQRPVAQEADSAEHLSPRAAQDLAIPSSLFHVAWMY